MSINVSRRNTGINFTLGKLANVRLWAPLAQKATLHLQRDGTAIGLQKQDYGYWHTVTDKIRPGDKYLFSINEEQPFPDPASLAQLHGVHQASTAVDTHTFQWTDNSWKNLPLDSYILYELHTGVFTPAHHFSGIIDRLDYLVDLGINAIEIMPVAQFPGTRNWGYDGVYPFAVQDSYGGVKGLQELVNACHNKGIAVVLDVIYNHIGPEGNYFSKFGPYFTDKYSTPWGKALNFDDAWCNGVRDYFIENALMWFRDFHIDALRMDAVHAIRDLSAKHIIKEIRQYVDQLTTQTGRSYYLIAELDLNDPVFINPQDKGGYGTDAQWIDEFHHALRVSAGQPPEGYYSDFNGIKDLSKSYRDAYVYDGQFSGHRKKFFGAKTGNPGKQFVVFSQNHDQTGNRMLGERTSTLVSFEMQKLLAGAVIVSPSLPMFFMGEEYSEPHPFLFFISHTNKELAAAVNKGRKEEFSYFNWEGEPPDPRLEETFNQSLLQWPLLRQEPHRTMHAYYKMLIALRKQHPVLRVPDRRQLTVEANEDSQTLILTRWQKNHHLLAIMNFSKKQQTVTLLSHGPWKKILDSADEQWKGTGSSKNEVTASVSIHPESLLIYEIGP